MSNRTKPFSANVTSRPLTSTRLAGSTNRASVSGAGGLPGAAGCAEIGAFSIASPAAAATAVMISARRRRRGSVVGSVIGDALPVIDISCVERRLIMTAPSIRLDLA